MSSRKRRRKNPENRKPRTQVKDMVRCPMCNALSYPRVFHDPKDEDEKKAVFCGSCNTDMMPYFEAYEEFARKKQEERLAKEAEEARLKLEEVNKVEE